jgi:hypothetical protein
VESFLLAVHVLAGILFVGPVAVTTSLFPRFVPVRTADGGPAAAGARDATRVRDATGARDATGVRDALGPPAESERHRAVAQLLHQVTRRYGMLALAVPVIGLVLAGVQGRLGEIWIVLAMVLTALAGGLLALRIAPVQRDALETPGDRGALRGLMMTTGVFNLIWAVVVVLMIVRPGAS